MMVRSVFFFALTLVAPLTFGAEVDEEWLSEAVDTDDECTAGNDGEGCSLSALQLRASRQSSQAEVAEVRAPGDDDEGATEVESAGAADDDDGEGAAEASDDVGAADDDDEGTAETRADDDEEGEGGEPADDAPALLARSGARAGTEEVEGEALDDALSRKKYSDFCKGKREGHNCIPNQNGHSNSWVYCSAGRPISGRKDCNARKGRMSWCVGGGIGLSHDYCDDPFCRNGGALYGNGHYCHNDRIVLCQGQNAPRIIDACADRVHTDISGCKVTEERSCFASWPHPQCMSMGTHVDCSHQKGGYGSSSGSAYR